MRVDIKKRERQSSIEMLRIISMFLVLVIHANAFGEKWQNLDFKASFGSCMTTVFLQTISCVCVNVFVLISGWFGIHFSIKGLCKFLFQCVFFLFGIYIFMLLLGKTRLSVEGISGCLLFLKWNWFIKTYIMLYIISPILNCFIENAQKAEYFRILLLFFVFQTIYGWLTNGAPFFEYGQSLTSFVGLYLLAQYVRRYKFTTLERWGG